MDIVVRLFKVFKKSWIFFKKVILALEYTTNREIFSREISFEADAILITETDVYWGLIMCPVECQEYRV